MSIIEQLESTDSKLHLSSKLQGCRKQEDIDSGSPIGSKWPFISVYKYVKH